MKQVELIWDIISILDAGKTTKEVFDNILAKAATITNATAATIWMSDKNRQHIYPFAFFGDNSRKLVDIELEYGDGICGRCIHTGETIFVEDCTKENSWFREADKVTGFKTRTIITVPIKNVVNDVIGCMQLLNKKNDRLFDIDDAHNAAIIAEKLSIWFQKNNEWNEIITERIEDKNETSKSRWRKI